MPFNNLLLSVSVDDGVQAFERPAAHQVPHALLLNPEPLDLVVDVEEQGVVPGRIIRGSENNKKAFQKVYV